MKKQHKIKRYRYGSGGSKGILKVLLSVAGLGVLIFVGISIYDPVYNFIMGNYERKPRQESSQQGTGDASQTGQEGQSQAEEPEPEPEVRPAGAMPNAVYLPLATAADDTALDAFLQTLEGTGVNSVMVDIKDRNGNVLFKTTNADAIAWGAATEDAGVDLKALSGKLEAKGMTLTVRMPAFADPIGARGNDSENGIRYQGGEWMWLDAAADAGGRAWINPYSPTGKQYIIDLAVEAVDNGAAFVILETVQFPDGSANGNATYGSWSNGVSRQQALTAFVGEAGQAVEAAGGQLGVYVTALTVTQDNYNDVRFGGSPLEILEGANLVLGLLPYQFQQRVSIEGLELESAYENPAETVKAALSYVQDHLNGREITILPLLQGGYEASATAVQVSPQTVADQIAGASGLGAEGFILYQTGGTYDLSQL